MHPRLRSHARKARSVPLLFGRDCVVCTDTNPTCPTCASGETCQLTVQSCSECAKTYCTSVSSSASATASSSSSSSTSTSSTGSTGHSSSTGMSSHRIGGIIAGVICAVVFATLVIGAFLYYNRRRRARYLIKVASEKQMQFEREALTIHDGGDDADDEDRRLSQFPELQDSDSGRPLSTAAGAGAATTAAASAGAFAYANPDAAQSSHTVASVASSTVTRASNIVPIAYIPGVINRSNPNSPSYIPPLPEMPAEHMSSAVVIPADASVQLPQQLPPQEQMMIMNSGVVSPSRGMSVYSGRTYDSQDDQSIRESIGIRDSVATSAFRSTVYAPALMTGIWAKANLIEKKTSS
ncbi:uncharacterized protein V1518DRAFT_420704 [Limtongia smithiae]|uniref:uncharacterized protein n=1 Tax=Limtongia smithiae TaxID=1125753 RepID=UPI0034CFD161